MIKGTVELESCSVAVTPNSVVLTVRSVEGRTYTITMPRSMGETMAEAVVLGMQNVTAETPQAVAGVLNVNSVILDGRQVIDQPSEAVCGATDLRATSHALRHESPAGVEQVRSAQEAVVRNSDSSG